MKDEKEKVKKSEMVDCDMVKVDISEKNPTEKRLARLAELDREIANFQYAAEGEKEKEALEEKRKEEYLSKKSELEARLGPLGVEANELIHKNIVDDVLESAGQENEQFDRLALERQGLVNVGLAEDLLAKLDALGIVPREENQAELLDVLTSAKFIDYERRKLVELMGIDLNNKEYMDKLSNSKDLNESFNRVLRGQLISAEYRELLLAHEVAFAGREEFEKSGANELAKYFENEINDFELTELGIEKIKQIVRKILNDKECNAGQGEFWNVLVPKEIVYVLKAERQKEDKSKQEYQKRSLFYYPVIRDVVGKEFLPRQVILKSENSSRLFVLQEKQEIDATVKVKLSTIDLLVDGSYGQEIVAALAVEDNKIVLRRFIEGVRKLLDEKKLMIDMIGDNLFFQVTEGKLEIKLIDYGCFEAKWENRRQEIVEGLEMLEKLENLIR
ncbi:MAG: hypothetical protein WAV73_05650 [Candidatus Moraniibacteriota bacterium]